MATPLVASYRIQFPYRSQGRPHSIRTYCRIATLEGVHPLIQVRTGDVGIDWTDAADQFFTRLANVLPAGSTFGTALLQQLVGIVWNPVDSTGAPGSTFSGTAYPATELTAVLRDSTFKKIRVNVLDINAPAPFHSPSEVGVPTTVGHFLDTYNPSASDFDATLDAYNWQVGRSNNFLASNPFAGVTIDLNDRMRRDAGLV